MAKVGAGGSAAAPSSRGPCACILATPRDRAASPARTFFFGWLCSSGIAARPLCVRCLSPFAPPCPRARPCATLHARELLQLRRELCPLALAALLDFWAFCLFCSIPHDMRIYDMPCPSA